MITSIDRLEAAYQTAIDEGRTSLAAPSSDWVDGEDCLEACAQQVQLLLGFGPADPTAEARWSDDGYREEIIVSW